MLDFANIKLIIWDLDETLWSGTISDNESILLNNKFTELINASLDRGIVHSICSKNDFDSTKAFLIHQELWDLFVFPSISWSPKGERIKQIIEDMNLRAENVLFVDDNSSNLNEAMYYCPGIQICTPDELIEVTDNIYKITKTNKERPRLAQYRLLEKKVKSQETFSSNEDFLMSCNIRVEFNYDCLNQIDRIHELILRSNQLNYTKFRQNKGDLIDCLNNQNTESAYITVKDNFGDYGIVGFYMLQNGKITHYLFSCRTLGMLVEQYVYMKIGKPEINVVGDVVTALNNEFIPQWINQETTVENSDKTKGNTGNKSILFKGPCDINLIFTFIEETDGIKTEFTYVNDQGISVEGYNHTSQIATALKAGKSDKKRLIKETPWLDEKMLDATQWKNQDAIIFSMLTDGNLGIYQHKDTGWQIALCEKHYDLTDPANWNDYIQKKVFTSFIDFTKDNLNDFADKYTYIDNSEGDTTISNLDILYNALEKDTKLILILGSEIPFEGKTKPSYENRHIFHKVLNEKIKIWSKNKPNVFLIEIGNYINSQKDYTNTINHFQKKVYYYMAQDILSILNTNEESLKTKGKAFLYFSILKGKIKNLLMKFTKNNNWFSFALSFER